MLFNKKEKTNFLELYSNENIGHTLTKLKFESLEDLQGRYRGQYKMRQLETESAVFAELLRTALTKRRKFGKYIYEIRGGNLTRFDPTELSKEKKKPQFSISKPFKRMVDLEKGKGIVYKVE